MTTETHIVADNLDGAVGEADPTTGEFTTGDFSGAVSVDGLLNGAIENNLNAMEFGAQVLGLMTDPRLLNVMCEDPSGGYMVNAIPDGHLTSLGLAFVDSNPDTITDTGSQFVTQGFLAGNKIHVSGSTSNDGIYTIATVAAGTLTLVGGDTLTAEAAGDRVTIDVVGTYEGTWTASDRLKQGKTWVLDPNGTDAYIDFGDSDDFSYGDGANDSAFTLIMLIEIVASVGTKMIITKWDGTTAANVYEWMINIQSTQKLKMFIGDDSAVVSCSRESDEVLSEGLHLVVVPYSGLGGATAANGITLYVDGLRIASIAVNNGAYVAMENTVNKLLMNAWTGTAGLADNFNNGNCSLLAIDAVEWSAEDVWALWNLVLSKYSENGVDLT